MEVEREKTPSVGRGRVHTQEVREEEVRETRKVWGYKKERVDRVSVIVSLSLFIEGANLSRGRSLVVEGKWGSGGVTVVSTGVRKYKGGKIDEEPRT